MAEKIEAKSAAEPAPKTREALQAALHVCETERDRWADRAAALEAALEPAAAEPGIEAEPEPEGKKGSGWRSELGNGKPVVVGSAEAVA